MSLPRQVVPGRVYLITRRCTQRAFLLRPDADTNNAFLYCLGVAAQRTDVAVLFFLAMSNHYHAGVVDQTGRLPEFLELFHKLLAKHQNVLRRRTENFWATEQTSAVELVDSRDALEKMVYTLANPVNDHLVERAHQWPGASSLAANLDGRVLRAVRPWRFFRKEGPMPESVRLTVHRPPGFEHFAQAEFAALLSERIAAVEQEAARARATDGSRVLGRGRVRRQDWRGRARSEEPRGSLSPRVACKSKWRHHETLGRNKAWLDAYRAARDLWLKGMHAIFPAGTYWLRRFAGVCCVPLAATG
jgi:hypothetical protein